MSFKVDFGHAMGAIPDPKDNRDLLFSEYLQPQKTPTVVDWFDRRWIIRDQGQVPACVGYAGAALKTAQELVERDEVYNFSGDELYKLCKAQDGLSSSGTYLRVLCKVLRDTGASWQDKNYKVQAYTRLYTVPDFEYAIAATGPILMGIEVFYSTAKPPKGYIDVPGEGEESQGGHAILVSGYDKNAKMFKMVNSWGEEWGSGGTCLMSYEFVKKHAFSAWSAIDLEDPITQSFVKTTLLKQQVALIDASNNTKMGG